MFNETECHRRWRALNPEKIKVYSARGKTRCKKWYENHKEEHKAKNKKWRLDHPKRTKELHKRWYENHKTQALEKSKKYRATHLEQAKAAEKKWVTEHKEHRRESHKKWYAINKERRRREALAYQKTPKGKEVTRRVNATRKNFGFIPLNKPFAGSHAHHININYVIYIPEELHRGVYHCIRKNKNMKKINKLAFSFMNQQTGGVND